MELAYLRELLQLSKRMNYLQASEDLFISQSTLSRHIQLLEEELGAELFHRTTRKIELSEFGKRFLPYAEEIVAVQDRYNSELLVVHRRKTKVTVGFGGAMMPYNAPEFFRRFQQENPDVELEVLRINGDEIDKLRSGQCDFLLTGEDRVLESNFRYIPYVQDYLVAVVSAEHQLAGRKEIAVCELATEDLVLMPRHAQEDNAFMIACRQAGFSPRYQISNGINMIDFAALGHSVPIMTKEPAVYFADESVCVLDIVPRMADTLVFIYRKEPKLMPAEQRFLQYLNMMWDTHAL